LLWPLPLRELGDQRDVDELVPERVAVRETAMLVELLAVVGRNEDERVVVAASFFQRLDQRPDQLLIDRPQLGFVEQMRNLTSSSVSSRSPLFTSLLTAPSVKSTPGSRRAASSYSKP
jgi:hypothetical protein